MNILDLCSGIGGFAVASQKLGWNILGFAEIDPYSSRVLSDRFDNPNFNDVNTVAFSENNNPFQHYIDDDLVPCEELGHDLVSYQDFMTGVVEFPQIICAGSPCQDISSSSPTSEEGIYGNKSSLVMRILEIIEDLNSDYVVFENSSNLVSRGLCVIIKKLMEIGYICEWETISAAHFGFNHYRHRCFLVAYRKDLYNGSRLFDAVRSQAINPPDLRIPLVEKLPEYVLSQTFVANPKSIKNRQARIEGLGNAVIPQIAESIFIAIKKHLSNQDNSEEFSSYGDLKPFDSFPKTSNSKGQSFTKLPARGFAVDGFIEEMKPCRQLNPTKSQYANMLSTLLANDRKNNFSTKSRLNRPGKLGGLVGDLMAMGVREGALHPNFAERFMGFPTNHTLLKEHEITPTSKGLYMVQEEIF